MIFDANGWLDEAIEIDYLNKSMDRQGYKISHICLHGTAGGSSAENIANYFATSPVDASAHFVIGQDGHIVQGVPLSLAAWGNGVLTAGHASYLPDGVNPNFYTVSIEHVKPSTDNSDQLTALQQTASFRLIACICDTYGVAKRAADASSGVLSHADIDPVNRARCPGPYPWDALWTYLKGAPPVQPDQNIVKAATDTWKSTAFLFGGTPLPDNTGIAGAWKSAYVNQHINLPPPTTHEFPSVDWEGNPIIVQFFGSLRCEWDASGVAHWYEAGF